MNEIERYQAAGIAVTIGGLEQVQDLIQQRIDELSAQLAGLRGIRRTKQSKHSEVDIAKSTGVATYWAKMSPKERSAEMDRRIAVRKRKAAKTERTKNGRFPVTDERNPKHDAWLKNLRKARKRAWNTKTAAEKEAWKTKMHAGRERSAA